MCTCAFIITAPLTASLVCCLCVWISVCLCICVPLCVSVYLSVCVCRVLVCWQTWQRTVPLIVSNWYKRSVDRRTTVTIHRVMTRWTVLKRSAWWARWLHCMTSSFICSHTDECCHCWYSATHFIVTESYVCVLSSCSACATRLPSW